MKKLMLQVVIAATCFVATWRVWAQSPHEVSMIQLIANPQSLDGNKVRVIGFVHMEFEGNAVYLHREDFERSIAKNGLSINLSDSQSRRWRELNNQYVIIEGTFSYGEKGHFESWSGSLQDITRLTAWSVNRSRKAPMK